MNDAERFQLLHGPYRQPRYRLGGKLFCERRGWVPATRISDAPIPWPLTTGRCRRPSLILCGDLVQAVRRESATAVAHWWGVTSQTVTLWRRVLEVPRNNEGTRRLLRAWAPELLTEEKRAKALAAACTSEANAKKAAAKVGKPRPRHVIEAMRAGRRGKPHDEATRRKMSAAHRRRGTRPPAAGRPWTEEEDELLRALPPPEVARQTGRTLTAVYSRRLVLGLPDGRAGRRIPPR
jgi:hypothetical protein